MLDEEVGTDVTPLVLSEVGLRYGTTPVLDDITLALTPGVTALVGVNGAGKTTLMSVASGALRPSTGSVSVSGLDPYGRQRSHALGKVALMPQALPVPRNMTAGEVVAYLAWMRGLSSRQAQQRADRALQQVGLAERASVKVGRLSGGMLRRVALAQALAVDADVVLLDEPSTGLDPEQRRVMVELIAGVRGTVLMSSHVMEDVVEVADRVIVLHAGRIAFDGPVTELQARAPQGTELSKAAEVGFLQLIAGVRAA